MICKLSNSCEGSSLKDFSSKYSIVLGSASFTRKLILQENGFNFTIIKSDIDEKAIGDRSSASNAYDLVTALAHAKADAVIKLIPLDLMKDDNFLLTADQVVVHGDKILEKPRDEEEARYFISLYSNGQCSTVGSIALTHLKPPFRRVSNVDKSTIFFDEIPKNVIDEILSEGIALQCAGGLMVEHPLLQPYIKKLDGTQEGLMGLSCILLRDLFCQLTIE